MISLWPAATHGINACLNALGTACMRLFALHICAMTIVS
jgi:hypothetical protein